MYCFGERRSKYKKSNDLNEKQTQWFEWMEGVFAKKIKIVLVGPARGVNLVLLSEKPTDSFLFVLIYLWRMNLSDVHSYTRSVPFKPFFPQPSYPSSRLPWLRVRVTLTAKDDNGCDHNIHMCVVVVPYYSIQNKGTDCRNPMLPVSHVSKQSTSLCFSIAVQSLVLRH